MKLLVQEYLENKSLGDLAREHGVYASFSKTGHKFSLNYDQIEAKEADPLAQECRGLILSLTDGQVITVNRETSVIGPTKVLAYPMKRFFNYGQGSAAEIDWSDPKLAILEKLDGTLCIVYFDPWTRQWCVATRAVPEADLLMDNGLFTFRTLFEKALKETCGKDFNEFTQGLNASITYCFELTTPYNRIVVNYPNCRVTLLAARALYGEFGEFDFTNLGGYNWIEYDKLDEATKKSLTSLGHDKQDTPQALVRVPFDLYGVPVVQAYAPKNVTELVDWVSSLNPMEHEGVVVRDSKFNRIKVKNAAYVAYNKVRDQLGTSERNCIELILAEKDDDVIPMLPEEIVKNLQKLKLGLQEVIRHHDEAYGGILPLVMSLDGSVSKKDFAIMAQRVAKEDKGRLWTSPLFQMFDGKAKNMKDFIQQNRKGGSWGNSFLDKLLELSKISEA